MYLIIKRIFDFISSLLVSLLISPFLLPIIILLRFTSEGEVFYLQERVGFKNKAFKIFKFATMLKNSPNMSGGCITTKNDPRLTLIGGALRKTKINELPQLINVLLGNMSVVGPRPVMPVSFDAYPKEIQKYIYDRKPGITGIGSIVFRDEEELITKVKEQGNDVWQFYKNTIYPYKGKLELWYQENCSFALDMKLIFITIWVIFFPNSTIYKKWFPDLPVREF